MARVVFLEPYLGGSHEAFARGWREHSRHEVAVLGLPGRFWRWRLQGASVTLAERTAEEVAAHGPPDLVVASDLLDLASYLGATRRVLRGVPAVLYLHEHQAAHPAGENEADRVRADRWAPMANWRSMHAADAVWCNSHHLLGRVVEELRVRLDDVPDEPQSHLVEGVLARCSVLPVGVDLTRLHPPASRPAVGPEGPVVLWNHRWDHDKGIGRFLRAVTRLADEGVPFRLALLGEDDHHDPDRFANHLGPLHDRILVRGPLPRAGYEDWLRRSDVVVAAPRQENFGISVIEAVAAGAVPVLPDALVYPEIVGRLGPLYREGFLAEALREVLEDLPAARRRTAGSAGGVRRFDWSEVAPLLDAAVDRLTLG